MEGLKQVLMSDRASFIFSTGFGVPLTIGTHTKNPNRSIHQLCRLTHGARVKSIQGGIETAQHSSPHQALSSITEVSLCFRHQVPTHIGRYDGCI